MPYCFLSAGIPSILHHILFPNSSLQFAFWNTPLFPTFTLLLNAIHRVRVLLCLHSIKPPSHLTPNSSWLGRRRREGGGIPGEIVSAEASMVQQHQGGTISRDAPSQGVQTCPDATFSQASQSSTGLWLVEGPICTSSASPPSKS